MSDSEYGPVYFQAGLKFPHPSERVREQFSTIFIGCLVPYIPVTCDIISLAKMENAVSHDRYVLIINSYFKLHKFQD